MSETPNPPMPEDDGQEREAESAPADAAPGVEVGMSEGEGSTFEPEEDPKP